MPTSTRVRALLGAAVLGGGLLLAPGLASAAAPAPSCADYVTQPDAQAAFIIERVRLAPLDPDGNGIACEELPAVLPTRVAALAATGQNGADGADAGTDVTATSTTSATTAATPAADTYQDLIDDVDTLECGSTYNQQLGALNARFLALLQTEPSDLEEQGAYDDALTATTKALNYCVATTIDIDPTASDGSVAITDGGQVSVVPEGSAETGEA